MSTAPIPNPIGPSYQFTRLGNHQYAGIVESDTTNFKINPFDNDFANFCLSKPLKPKPLNNSRPNGIAPLWGPSVLSVIANARSKIATAP